MSQKFESFGKYILLEKLASGGMAEVYLARSPSAGGIGRFVAIKKMLPQFSDNHDYIQMFKEEAKIALNLSHSNIVSIYEFGIFQGQLFLVMDYVSGRNLRQILNKMKSSKLTFTEDQVAYILKEVTAGLDHAHRCLSTETGKPLNITHRDMSPQNVMVSFEGEVKIVDFGIAKADSTVEVTKTGTLKGKFGYMSPEQVEGHPLDLRTDIFSVGIITWEILANERLFLANNEINTLKKIRECEVPSLTKMNPNISPELERIIQKALARDRNLRYQTAAAFHRDLNRFLNRHYPDFSAHDFSVFVKTLYTEEILNIRKKHVEYSQVNVGDTYNAEEFDADDDKTIVTGSLTPASEEPTVTRSVLDDDQTLTQTQTSTSTGTGDYDPSDLSVGTIDSSIIDNEALKNIGKNIDSNSGKHSNVLHLEQKATHKKKKSMSIEIESPAHNKKAASGGEYQNPPKRVRKDGSFSLFNLVLIMTLLVGLYYVFEPSINEYLGSQARRPNSSEAPKVVEDIIPTGQKAAPRLDSNKNKKPILPPQHNTSYKQVFVFNSSPGGAEIYINDKPVGKTTPDRVEINAGKPFKITLKKEGYLPYEQDVRNPRTFDKSFMANLQKANIGHINIDVIPPQNVVLYVNGKKVSHSILPIYGYSVPAKTPILIKAVNTATGQYVTDRVTLGIDERRTVTLKMKRKRIPSSNNRK